MFRKGLRPAVLEGRSARSRTEHHHFPFDFHFVYFDAQQVTVICSRVHFLCSIKGGCFYIQAITPRHHLGKCRSSGTYRGGSSCHCTNTRPFSIYDQNNDPRNEHQTQMHRRCRIQRAFCWTYAFVVIAISTAALQAVEMLWFLGITVGVYSQMTAARA